MYLALGGGFAYEDAAADVNADIRDDKKQEKGKK